jgi:hypothetical protein
MSPFLKIPLALRVSQKWPVSHADERGDSHYLPASSLCCVRSLIHLVGLHQLSRRSSQLSSTH